MTKIDINPKTNNSNLLCHKCNAHLEYGKALQNTPRMGVPDFPGNTIDSRGQTFNMTGPPVMVGVWKCPDCGHSILAV